MKSKTELPAPEPCWLYFIECRSGAIYTGISRDVNARYNLHVSGKGARYTRMNPPRRLIGSKEYANRTEAARAEIWFKQLTADEKRGLVSALFRRIADRHNDDELSGATLDASSLVLGSIAR